MPWGRDLELLEGQHAVELYSALRDLSFGDSAIAARISMLPNQLARCARESAAEYVAHVGSGIAELWSQAADPQRIAQWRALAHSARGYLQVISAPASIRPQIEFFDRPNPGVFKLMKRLKGTFDPANIFNPGCFVGAL